MDEHGADTAREPAERQRRWIAAAFLLYGVVLACFYGDVWREGITRAIPSAFSRDAVDSRRDAVRRAVVESDALYSVWVVGRNAFTLLHRPSRLFHGERCYPTRLSMALGEPMISLSILGLPAFALTGDPVVTFNVAVAAAGLVAALAMFLLVSRWTGEPAAGIAAGLLYAFHTVKLAKGLHPYVHDTAWTVLGLYFAREWFAAGRWRDALGLSASCSMQLGASFYPALGAVALAIPVLIWLLVRYGVRNLRAAQIAVVTAVIAAAATLIFTPYLELRATTEIRHLGPAYTAFGRWDSLLPGGRYFPGWLTLALFAAAIVLGPRPTRREPPGDPRLALLAGALLAALLAAGGNAVAVREGTAALQLPNPYTLLSRVLPGLDQVRVPAALFSAVSLVETLLAGLGAAAVLRRIPARRRSLGAGALLLATTLYVLRPDVLPLDPQAIYEPYRVRPPQAALDFYARLDELGNRGPLVEVPMSRRNAMREGAALLLSAYHHRETSACTSKSYFPVASLEIDALAKRLPDPEAAARLREVGFTTVVFHHPPDQRWATSIASQMREASTRPDSPLRRLHGNRIMTAYALAPPGAPP